MGQRDEDFAELRASLVCAEAGVGDIPPARREALDSLAAFLRRGAGDAGVPALLFVCTHNSRRSVMGQAWAAAAAAFYGIEGLRTFSGGTEVTAVFPETLAALARAGFKIAPAAPDADIPTGSPAGHDTDAAPDADSPDPTNPAYHIRWSPTAGTILRSRLYTDPDNPASHFAAVMTCDDADANCPFIPGAGHRCSLPYQDPKTSDHTPRQSLAYDERSLQIATEMCYLFMRMKL